MFGTMTTDRTPLGRALLAFLSLGTLALLLGACSGGDEPDATPEEGVWGDPDTDRAPSLEFVPADGEPGEGDYFGTDGCNRLGGSYRPAEDGAIDLGLMRSTLMYCEGVDTWLSQARTAVIEQGAMVFRDETGEVIGSLARPE